MNWNFVMWFAGILATFAAIKFLMVTFKSLFSKESMQNVLDRVGDGVSSANEKLTEKMKEKVAERRQRKRDENRAEVVIR